MQKSTDQSDSHRATKFAGMTKAASSLARESNSSGKRASGLKTFSKVSALVGQYIGQAVFLKLKERNRVRRLRVLTENVSKYSRKALEQIRFDINVFGQDAGRLSKPHLLICNHMSYLDILTLSSIQPCVFVTSADMGEQLGLGHLCELGGSIFIERRHRGHIDRDIKVIADCLSEGFNVVLYPEGTSTDGSKVLPFKKSLLMAATKAGVNIQPICLKYTHINGEPFSEKNRDLVCWYGDTGFFPHFKRICAVDSVRVELHFLDPIEVNPESTRHELADKTYQVISDCYQQPAGC
jgi:lyso-ornithine lipid O-acyltransferase